MSLETRIIVFPFPQNEPFISTEGSGSPSTESAILHCCVIQQLTQDKQSTVSRGPFLYFCSGLCSFSYTLVCLVGCWFRVNAQPAWLHRKPCCLFSHLFLSLSSISCMGIWCPSSWSTQHHGITGAVGHDSSFCHQTTVTDNHIVSSGYIMSLCISWTWRQLDTNKFTTVTF